jgi:hypothetical protein
VREVAIVGWEVAGSHTVFLCSVLTDETRAHAPQLFHTSGIHSRGASAAALCPGAKTSPA